MRDALEYVLKEPTRVESLPGNGEITPSDGPGSRTDLADLHEAIMEGQNPDDVLLGDLGPKAFRYGSHLDRLAAARDAKEWAGKVRELDSVMFIHGRSGVGKTSSLITQYGEMAYRVTDYDRDPFGGYITGQHQVLIFDEFHGQLPITAMLEYLQGFPMMLPARYRSRQASYTRVYVASNLRINQLYPNIQEEKPDVWRAFKRRFTAIKEMRQGGLLVDSG